MPNVITNDLVSELIASVEAYNPGVDKELIRRAFEGPSGPTGVKCGAPGSRSSTIRWGWR